jgi:outer membrane protein TolC
MKRLALCPPAILCLLLMGFTTHAAEPLPEPLTLEYALSLADEGHPDLLVEQAEQARLQAQLEGVDASNAVDISAEGRARWVDPPSIVDGDVADDHKLSLYVRKPLYDFGRTDALRQAARQASLGREQRYQAVRDSRRIAIMQSFFDVLLSDMEYARDNEALAVAYIALDRLRDRQQLGQASDIDVLEKEAEYQRVRYQLAQSEARQRATRARLANLLNRPGMLPSNLRQPQLDYQQRKLPEFETLVEQALKNNPEILALQSELQAAQQGIEAARAEQYPRLDGELEASAYSREIGSYDRWRAGVTLQVPIYSGGRVDAAVASQRAQQSAVQARLDKARYDLRQQVLDLRLELQSLKLLQAKANSEQDYRELYLDRSRANYEMEFTADLGDAMVRLSEAQLGLAQVEYQFAIAWERLDALTGGRGENARVAAEGSGP